jgi:hypothetical protein
VLVRFDHVALTDLTHFRIFPRNLAPDFTHYFSERLRALYGAGEAVIEVGRAEDVETRQGSPRNLGLAVAQLSVPIGILIAFGSPYHSRPNGSGSEIRSTPR